MQLAVDDEYHLLQVETAYAKFAKAVMGGEQVLPYGNSQFQIDYLVVELNHAHQVARCLIWCFG